MGIEQVKSRCSTLSSELQPRDMPTSYVADVGTVAEHAMELEARTISSCASDIARLGAASTRRVVASQPVVH